MDKRSLDNFTFGRLRTFSEVFGRLRKTSNFFGRIRTSSGIFGNDRVIFKNPSTPRIKISRLYLRKSWQVYYYVIHVVLILGSIFLSVTSVTKGRRFVLKQGQPQPHIHSKARITVKGSTQRLSSVRPLEVSL